MALPTFTQRYADSFKLTTPDAQTAFPMCAGTQRAGRVARLRIVNTVWGTAAVTLKARLIGSDTAGAHDSPEYKKISATATVAGGTTIVADGIYEVVIDGIELLLDYAADAGTLTIEGNVIEA